MVVVCAAHGNGKTNSHSTGVLVMAKVIIIDPSGTREINNLFYGDWLFASIVHFSSSQLTTKDSDGITFSLFGDLSSFDIDEWTLTGISVFQGTSFSADLSQFHISYTEYELSSVFDIIFDLDDSVTSDSPNPFSWNLGSGNDTINVGVGDDTINGGSGIDTLIVDDLFTNSRFYSTIYSTAVLISADGTDELGSIEIIEFDDKRVSLVVGSFGDDILLGNQQKNITRQDILLGADGKDKIYGKAGRDILKGEYGNDTLKGGRGSDKLFGGYGNDLIIGGHGNDRIFGQEGNDTLIGGANTDYFVFKKGDGNDTIIDFDLGTDHIKINKGANNLEKLGFVQDDLDVLVYFSNVTILVKGISISELHDSANFMF